MGGDLTGQVVVDVGSRLGAIIYGGCLLSNATKLVGVERLRFFCELQRQQLRRHGLSTRATVLEADICSDEGRKALREADVVIMHNIFEFFASSQEEAAAWQ